MSAPQITVTFDPFTLDDNQEVIVQKSEAFVSNLTPWSTETNTLATWMNDQVSIVVGVGTGFVGNWSDQTGSAAKPFSVVHNNRIWTLLNNIADVTASEPGVSADWFAATVDATLINIEDISSGSVFIGPGSGQNDDGTNANVGTGPNSLSSNTSGFRNCASGISSMFSNTTGRDNCASGENSLFSNTSGSFNSSFGGSSGGGGDGDGNSNFGYKAGQFISSGNDNLTAGRFAGDSLISGSNNVLIGARTDVDAASSDCIVIGQGIVETGSNKLNIGGIISGDLSTGEVAFSGVLNATLNTAAQPNITSVGNLTVNSNATGTAFLEVGQGRTVDSSSFIDLIGDTTYTDYGLRIGRNPGANAGSDIASRGTGVLKLVTQEVADIELATNNVTRVTIDGGAGSVQPGIDNGQTLGTASFRWSEVFAGNGAINTSDETLKTAILPTEQMEKEAFLACKDLIGKYQMLDSIERKGEDNARWHFGIGAQSAIKEFTDRGLDWTRYSMFCLDEVDVFETQTVKEKKQATEMLIRETIKIKLVDGIPVQKTVKEEYESPVFAMTGIVNENGEAVLDENDEQLTHPVPVMIDVEVEEQVKIGTIERYGVRYEHLLAGIIACM